MKDFILLPFDNLDPYQRYAYREMMQWCKRMDKNPGLFNSLTSGIQKKLNSFIPDKVHRGITATMRQMIQGLMMGTKFISPAPHQFSHLKYIEDKTQRRIDSHRLTAAAEGGLTGAGGFLWSLADLPLLLGIKIKLLQDIAAIYGYNGKKMKEKIFLLLVLQMAFSSDKVRRQTLNQIIEFDQKYPDAEEGNLAQVDWHTLQQQYRDYIDLAKLLQMMPIIGAVVGTVANYRLVKLLGKTAIQCYRIRHFQDYGKKFYTHNEDSDR